MPSRTAVINELIPIVGDAHDAARQLLDYLATQGHPQTTEATFIFQHLTAIHVELFNTTSPPRLADLAKGLSDISTRCVEALSELRSVVDKAAGIASKGE